MDETSFHALADRALAGIMETAENVLADHLEADIQAGVLTLELTDGRQYVLNKHGPNREIWLSSPKSGASHYAWDAARKEWLSTRGGDSLTRLLADELTALTGTAVSFD
jgi:frataxin